MPPSVREILETHERSLEARIKSLRDQIIPLERELAEVRRAKGALTLTDYGPEQSQLVFSGEAAAAKHTPQLGGSVYGRSSYENLTIKELVRKALGEHFERGATANQLLEFFAGAWGRRDIARTSLSPQLSRLKRDGEIVLRGQKWILSTSNTADPQQLGKAATDQ